MKQFFRTKLEAMGLQKSLLMLALLLTSGMAFAQGLTVTGKVTSTSQETLVGVSVMVEGTTIGTSTDLDGNYTLKNVPSDATLQFSYLGFVDQSTAVNGRTKIDAVMEEDAVLLDEMVVIGYGVQKKSDVTGAISSIKSTDLANSTITDASSALQGKVSGVQVVNNSGAPGTSPTIRVRGYSSNGSSDPLYIVDGLKVSDISYLEPSAIESMEVLKDAASAAIYGAEAGNGVILITTKNGGKGNTKITFDAQWSFTSLANKVDVMNAEEYTQFYTEGAGDTFTAMYDNLNIAGTDTDWQDEMYETGFMQKYNLGLQGGNDKGSFFVSLGYTDTDGIVKMDKDYYERFSGQINASYKIRPWIEVGTSNALMYSNSSSISEDQQTGVMKTVLLASPLTPVYYSTVPDYIQSQIDAGLHPVQNSNGQYYGYDWRQGGGINPLAGVENQTSTYKTASINGMTYANITPVKNLVFTSRLGYTLGSVNYEDYHPAYMDSYNASADSDLRLSNTTYQTIYYQWENFLNYTLETKKAGNYSLMVGMSYSNYEQNYSGGLTNTLSSTASNYNYLNYSTTGADDYVIGDKIRRRQIAYYARFSWSWLNRYNVQANFRADSYDAAYLDLDHNWGYFPSVSAGWTFSNEPFMQNLVGNGFTFGKLRASFGVNGSISNLGEYAYAATLNTGQYDISTNTQNMAYSIDGTLYQGTYPSSILANPKLRWERSKQVDVGLDLRFFRDRLTANVDYYYKLTDGLLVASTATLSTGAQTVYQNLGEVVNTGAEIELGWHDNAGDFSYGIQGNISTVHNEVKTYRGEGTRISGTSLMSSSSALTFFEEGYPLWYIRGYQFDGVDSETGAPIYHDFDGDGEISDSDKTNLGSAIPDFTYGITLTAAYKGFDLMVYGTGTSGNDLVYGLMTSDPDSWQNRPMFLYNDRWTSTNTNASMPSAVYQINDERFYNSSAFVFNASYFKIKQIQLGYSLPKSLLRKINIDTFRIYVSLDNFFTFTDYPGSDPELNGSGSSSSALSLDFGGYPTCKSVSFGVNLAF